MNAYKKTLDCLKFQSLNKFNTKLSQNLAKMKAQKCLLKENEENSNSWGVWVKKLLKVKKDLKKHRRTKKESEKEGKETLLTDKDAHKQYSFPNLY